MKTRPDPLPLNAMPTNALKYVVALARTSLLLAIVLAGGTPPAGAQPQTEPEVPSDREERRAKVKLKRWNAGPARYLLTYDEHATYKRLDNDRDRMLFITKFWSRWDPSPGTLLNENRRDFWWRIQETSRRFRETRPGWMTDRGKMFILLGEPDEIIKDERQALLRWTYHGLPSPRADPITHIAFRRDDAAEWRMSRDAADYGPVFPGLSTSDANDPSFPGPGADVLDQVNVFLEMLEQGLETRIALDLAEATRVPDPIEEAADLITATEFLDRFPLTTRLAYFRDPDGETHVRIGAAVRSEDVFEDVAIPPDAQTYMLLFARFEGPDDSEQIYYASNETNAIVVTGEMIAAGDVSLTAWASHSIPPGRYRASLGLQDVATGQISSQRIVIDVPDLSARGLRISSVLPVSRLDLVDGRLFPIPRVDARFRRDEDIRLYYEIYGQAAGRTDSIEMAYKFYLREGDGERPVALAETRESLTEPTQGFSLPLDRFPAGSYRIEIIARDLASGKRASSSLDFEVVEAE